MHRIFLGLAVTIGTLLAVSFASGFLVPSGRGGTWRDLHFLLSLVAAMGGLLIHCIVFTYFLGTGKWIQEVVRVYRMPSWVWAQALRNKRRAFPFELFGMILIGASAWLGGAADTRRALQAQWAGWHLAVSAAALAFNLGAFVVEYASIVAQSRLVMEVKDQADKLREARAAASGPAPMGS